ncbi:LrgB family protein [Tepidicaulis sp. LMO-SS28]|uniref:LrgB family protein n=1 Tax=Tepidicaulis sp. LMO-SS28 TaxID=3447455 RepID=UPI003EE3F814
MSLAVLPLAVQAAFWIAVTLGLYAGALYVQRRLGNSPLANPVLLASAPIIAFLAFSSVPFASYDLGGRVLLFFLGPATVALAVPFFRNLRKVRAVFLPLFIALAAGSVTAVVSAVVLASALGADMATVTSFAPKSITTPIAMGVAEEIGGLPVLTAGFVIATGIIGAVLGGPMLKLIGLKDERALGLGLGVAAHGIGTARAFQVSPVTGTFAGVAMTLNGILTAVLLPVIWKVFM